MLVSPKDPCRIGRIRDHEIMLSLRWVIVIWIVGLVISGYGVAVENAVRTEIGSGARKFAAYLVARGEIEAYRAEARAAILIGPALMVVGLLLLRRSPVKPVLSDDDQPA